MLCRGGSIFAFLERYFHRSEEGRLLGARDALEKGARRPLQETQSIGVGRRWKWGEAHGAKRFGSRRDRCGCCLEMRHKGS